MVNLQLQFHASSYLDWRFEITKSHVCCISFVASKPADHSRSLWMSFPHFHLWASLGQEFRHLHASLAQLCYSRDFTVDSKSPGASWDWRVETGKQERIKPGRRRKRRRRRRRRRFGQLCRCFGAAKTSWLESRGLAKRASKSVTLFCLALACASGGLGSLESWPRGSFWQRDALEDVGRHLFYIWKICGFVSILFF